MLRKIVISIVFFSYCPDFLAQSIETELYLFQNVCLDGSYEIFLAKKRGFQNVGYLEKNSNGSILYSKHDNGMFLKSWTVFKDSVYTYFDNFFDYSEPIFIPYDCYYSSVNYRMRREVENLDALKNIRSYIIGSLSYRVRSDTAQYGKHLLTIGVNLMPELIAYDVSEFYNLKSNSTVVSIDFFNSKNPRYLIIDNDAKRLLIFTNQQQFLDFSRKSEATTFSVDHGLENFIYSTKRNCMPWSFEIKKKRRKCFSIKPIFT